MDTFLEIIQNGYLYCGIAGTAFFVFQFVLMLIGAGNADADGAGDAFDGSDSDFSPGMDAGEAMGMTFLSLRGISAFFATFGWAGLSFRSYGWNSLWIAFACGLLIMFIVALMMSLLMRLQTNGNLNRKDYIGKTGKVYLSIPPGRATGGRVIIRLDACTREVAACADDPIAVGTEIRVVEALSETLFLVKPLG